MGALDPPELEALDALPVEAAAGWLAAAQSRLASRLVSAVAEARPSQGVDRLLDVHEAAERTGMSEDWLYRRGKALPFARKVGRSLRFSEQGLSRWIASRRA